MKKLNIIKNNNNSYEIREEVHDGKDFIVVPVVMMVEGVHAGSKGPMLHLSEELGKIPESYNGIPVTIDHPKDENNNYISANSPNVIDNSSVGKVFNTVMDGNKLRGEAWIEKTKIETLSPEAAGYIRSGNALEVSLGLFSDEEKTSGEWNGEHYDVIARNNRPDHLALLPNSVGACSWDDGCGIRVNSKNKKGGNKMPKNNFIDTVKNLNKQGYTVNSFLTNESMSYDEITDNLRSIINKMDNDLFYHYIIDIYDDFLVYKKVELNNSQGVLYKQNYMVMQDGMIELVGDAVKVKKNVEYTEIQANRENQQLKTNKKEEKMSKKMNANEGCAPCKEKVDSLISNESTKFSEDDREWLSLQTEDVLKKLEPVKIETKPQVNEKEKEEPAKEVTREQAIEVLKEQAKSPESWLQFVPNEFREQFTSGLSLHNETRAKMISEIVSNSEGVYVEGDLKKTPMIELNKLHKAIVKDAGNYVMNNSQPSFSNNQDMPEPLGIPGMVSGEKSN